MKILLVNSKPSCLISYFSHSSENEGSVGISANQKMTHFDLKPHFLGGIP